MELNSKVYPPISRVMEMTAFKDEATVKAVIRTLMWLDKGAPHQSQDVPFRLEFDMYNYVYRSGFDSCGTTCCIAGAIKLFRDSETDVSLQEENISYGTTELGNDFGFDPLITEHPLTQLFYPIMVDGNLQSKSPEQAAQTLRNYLFTGVVKWN